MACENDYVKEKVFASLPRTTRGLPIIISGSPDNKSFLYCNGNSVFIRNVQDISECDVYTEHAVPTTVAKYSPSGFYIASGDQSGKVRIWDTTQLTHILKAEYPVIGGTIRDISWSEDSKRIAVVGEGREKFGHVFLFDTGTSNGNLSGQSRCMTSVDFRPVRPYRLISSSEDNSVAIFEGPPFKFKTFYHEHTRFTLCVRYNKDGSLFASAGADGRVILFDGDNGSKVDELFDENCKNAAHNGGVFSLSWNSNGKQLVTASGDKTIKIWNVPNRKLISTITFGTAVEDQQLGVLWLNNVIISVSLSGFINYIDPETNSILKVIKGHNRPITALTLSNDKKFAFTADFEGNITRWEIKDGSNERILPVVHKSQVSSLAISSDGTLVSTGWDDSIAFTECVFTKFDGVKSNSIKLSSQPRGVAISQNLEHVAVVLHKSIIILSKQKILSTLNISYEGFCVDIHPTKKILAVGGQDGKVYVYEFNSENGNLTEKKKLSHSGAVTSLRFSPNGKYLVSTDTARKVIPYDLSNDYKVCSEKDWTFHSARINCCAWSANSRYIATGSLDTNIIVWDLQNSGEHPIIIKGAHSMSTINCIEWISENRLLSAGQDSNLKQWTVKL